VSGRLLALDALRGLVMIVMTLDHASAVFNAGRLMNDGAALHQAGTPLPAAQFLTRWVTHLCAPTFVFLAGAALALSVERRRAQGEPEGRLDCFILTRGLLLVALEPLWMSPVFVPGSVLLQVLWAIGAGLVAMVVLRRLPTPALVAGALLLLVGGEALAGLALLAGAGEPTLPAALLVTGGRFGRLIVAYPLLPWLAMMMLGWAFGRWLPAASPERAARLLVIAGALALAVFAVVRGLDGYGNMRLHRDDGSLVQWLHVSKYPPSLSFAALELGLMALLLAAYVRLPATPRPALVVLGQTALVFYLLHVHLLALGAWAFDAAHRHGLPAAYLAAAAAVTALYPVSLAYRRYKHAHPDGWARYF
jgi:uncharacterized membrane protein